jgi:hypothetical protein
MKILSILLNIILLAMFSFGLIKFGLPEHSDKDFIFHVFMLTAMFLTPLVNLIYIFKPKDHGWVSLYFRRKALEEKKKIDDLQKK